MTKKRWARFSRSKCILDGENSSQLKLLNFLLKVKQMGLFPGWEHQSSEVLFPQVFGFRNQKFLMWKVYGTVEMESQKVPNRNGMWSKLPTGDHFPAVNSDLLRASRWKGFKKGTRIRNEEWIWQERLIVNLQKERLTTDVRYQDWTEMTLDYIKMCWSQGAVVKGHFFCPQGGLPMRARVRQSS